MTGDVVVWPGQMPEPPDDEMPTAPIARGLHDDGNALRLVDAVADRIRYCPQRGSWLTWDDYRWTWDAAGKVTETARHLIRTMPGDSDQITKHRTRSLSARAIGAMTSLARTDSRIVVEAHDLDAKPYDLCTPGGIVDLRTGKLGTPDPARNHTRATTHAPDPETATPRWDSFLAETFAGHPELPSYVQRLAGYSITGAVTHHVLPFLHGSGGNGKSVFLDVLRAVLGDYAATAPAGFLMATRDHHETEVARLHGLRFVICSEVNHEARFDEAKVKILTGGDALTARFMHQNHFTFTPTHHLWLMGNHKPAVSSGGGESFWRRLRLVPFTNTVPDTDRDDDLARALVEHEGPGILAWLIAGAVASHPRAGGLQDPPAVLTETRSYALEEDMIGRFLDDRCHLGGGALVRTNTKDVLDAYRMWCKDEGTRAVSNTVFGRELRTRFDVETARSHGRRFYLGLTLLDAPDEHDDAAPWYSTEPPDDPYSDDPGERYR